MLAWLSCADCTQIGRFEIASLSEQSVMELFIEGFESKRGLQDEDGNTLSINQIRGITLNQSGSIRILDLMNRSLSGTLKMEYLPQNAEMISVDSNCLEGVFSAALIPRTTRILRCGDNRLTGSLRFDELSSNIIALSVFSNRLNGSLNFSNFPKNLIACDLSRNLFQGRLDLSNIHKPVVADLKGFVHGDLWYEMDVDAHFLHLDLEKNQFEETVIVSDLKKFSDSNVFLQSGVKKLVDSAGNRQTLEFESHE